MNNAFDSIKRGLLEAIEHAQEGQSPTRTIDGIEVVSTFYVAVSAYFTGATGQFGFSFPHWSEGTR